MIKPEDIRYIRSQKNKSILYLVDDKELETSQNIRLWQEQLSGLGFAKIHKSYILNLASLSHIEYHMGGSYLAYLKDEDGLTLPVGRKYASFLKEKINIVH